MKENVFQSTFNELKRHNLVLDELRLSNAFHNEPLELLDSCETVDEVKAFKLMIEEFRKNNDFRRFCNESFDFLLHCKSILDRSDCHDVKWYLKECEGRLESLEYNYRMYKDYVDSQIRLKIASSCKSKLG